MTNAAIQTVNIGLMAYCKFLSANDVGDTGAHQSGIYIAKNALSILFDIPGVKGENKDKLVKIKWQNDFITDSRFIYYGTGTRNEYRITRFNKGFPFLRPEHIGDLFVLIKLADQDYAGYILSREEEINTFLNFFGLSPSDTNNIIEQEIHSEMLIEQEMKSYIDSLTNDFPTSFEMSTNARKIFNYIYDHEENIKINPDKEILSWLEMEYKLFRKIEIVRYETIIKTGFPTVDNFIEVANTVLNRRKSRAGKSLENHLSAIFDGNSLKYVAQPTTEGNKHPDFLFPNSNSYNDMNYPANKLVFLGAKTTCKDRWRQIINEANRITEKHLFTLQQGISKQQMDEMEAEHIILVVPEIYITAYPKEKRDSIWTLKKFVEYVKEKNY